MRSKTGECVITNGSTSSNGYRYHDKGFITLVPSSPIYRDVFMENEGTSFIANEDVFYNDTTEKYILINGTWKKIASRISLSEITVDGIHTGITNFTSPIVRMNTLVITPLTTMSLTMFEVNYSHTFE